MFTASRWPLFLFAALLLMVGHASPAQVMPTRDWARALGQARNLLPGTGDAGVPYHLHYDLHFRGPHGSDLTGTYDVYVDPYRFRRTDISSASFHETRTEDLRNPSASWTSITGDMPLGLYDFEGIVSEPLPALFALAHSAAAEPLSLHPQILEGSPYDCVDDRVMTRVCFDPLTHVFAIAQILNQSFVYSNWIPLRRRAVPSLIQIYDGNTQLVTATGTIVEVHNLPPLFFIQATPSVKTPIEQRPVVSYPEFKAVPWFGNAAVRITVDEQGKVKHAEVVEIDNHHVEHATLKFIRGLRFRPASETPDAPATFTAVFYLRYLPRANADPSPE